MRARIVAGNLLIGECQKQIFELALANCLPTMTENGQYVRASGLDFLRTKFARIIPERCGLRGRNCGKTLNPPIFYVSSSLMPLNSSSISKPPGSLASRFQKYLPYGANEVIE